MTVEQVAVLNHARRRTTYVKVLGVPVEGGFLLTRITCEECDGLGTTRPTETAADVIRRASKHASSCAHHYGPRSNKCVATDRQGDPITCPICR
ncbi:MULTISPECIES: hypothetical protein [Streptomyces]|uniref:hypothetical protein n=1 Tax=Streptomyces lycopersici TaxID=2974589 RepID=UPI0021D0A638|nr:hypothetical protein [Streptomyces sp. NEAU-383]